MTSKNHDAVDQYFDCISECDLMDGDCHTQCVVDLKEHKPLQQTHETDPMSPLPKTGGGPKKVLKGYLSRLSQMF
jgi:hypothetical protein